jgi:hypothetical protein
MGLVVSEDIFIANKQQELSRTAMLFAWSRTHTSMQILQGAQKHYSGKGELHLNQ